LHLKAYAAPSEPATMSWHTKSGPVVQPYNAFDSSHMHKKYPPTPLLVF